MSTTLCLIGHPLGHSLSPFIHKRLFELSGRDACYSLQDIEPNALETDFASLLKTIRGCNVTIPYKQRVLPLLDRVEGKAAVYQTVNTVSVTDDGIIGYNTDADGFLCALRDASIPLSGRVLVLGAGGAGTVLAFEAALAGCDVIAYDPFATEAAVRLCERIHQAAPEASCHAVTALPEDEFDLLINTSPVGMYPNVDACPVADDVIERCKAVFDVIYNPRETRLMQKATANGAKTAGGMAMLVWQAAIAHGHWFGTTFEQADIAALIDDCYTELARSF